MTRASSSRPAVGSVGLEPLRPFAVGLAANASGRLASHGVPSKRELSVVAGALTLLGAVLLGGHILHGGLYTDDWPLADVELQRGGALHLVKALFLFDHSRPLAALYLGLAQAAIGTDGHAHAALGLSLHILACWSIYWLLRTLTLGRWQAGAIVVLVLLFPFSDSTWLWFASSHANIALSLAALGLTAMVYAMRSEGRRSAVLNALAILLGLASVLTYEATPTVIVVVVLALQLAHAPRRIAILRSSVALVTVGAAVVIPRLPGLLPGSDAHTGIPLSQQLSHALTMAKQATTVLARSTVPFGTANRNIVLPFLGLIVALAFVKWRRVGRDSPAELELRRGLWLVAAGVVIVAAAYAVFVDANAGFYQPAAQGADNRINVVAAVGYCLVVYGAAILVALLLTPGRSRAAAMIAVLATALVAVGYAERARGDVRNWDRAAAIQRYELGRLKQSLHRPPPRTTIFTFGGVGMTALGVYAFRATWDLNSAVELLWRDRTLHAYPIFFGTVFICGASSLYPNGPGNGNGTAQTARYGHVLLFDFRDSNSRFIRSRADCLSGQRQFQPGPVT